jgi:23S rRNA (guanosine2251-2'-O)-methyltransferase
MKSSGGNRPRAGAVRKGRRGPQVGSGGQGRQALEGRGPTPKAEDRPHHPAAKRKAAAERDAASGRRRSSAAAERTAAASGAARGRRDSDREGRGRRARLSSASPRTQAARGGGSHPPRRPAAGGESEIVTGRNAVVEALRARIPATTLYVAARIDYDDRVKEIVSVAAKRGLPILEVMRPELDRMCGLGSVHQGVALKVPPYEYARPLDLLDRVLADGQTPLLVALDGVTDPRNLGAIVRSTAAFGGHGVLVPQRRSVGMTAAAWKTSAGAAARTPVAMAGNLTRALNDLKQRGVFVLGLDGAGEVALPGLTWAREPLVVVVGSEGKGLSRLVAQTCDAIVSIPISASTESLNAGIATGVALYEIATLRAGR